MMRIGLVLGLVVLCLTGASQGDIDRTFMRRYNYGGMQGGLALATTEDGGFVATGQHEGNGSAGGCDIYVYKVDACGNRIWFRLFGTGNSEGGKSIEPTPDGGFIIGGHGSGGLLLKLNEEGEADWYYYYSGIDWIFDAVPTQDGGYVALGRSNGSPVVLKVDEDGLVEWGMRYPEFHDMPMSISQLANGDYLFVTNQAGVGRDVDVARVDENGSPVWMRRYGGGFNDFDHTTWGCNALVDDDENVAYITSPTVLGSMSSENILLMKLDLDDGEPVWSKSFGSNGIDQSRALTATSTGIAIVGNTTGFPTSASSNPDTLSQDMGEKDVLMFHITTDGEFEWGRTYGGNERDKGIGVRYDEENDFTISAYTSSSVFGNADGSMDPLFIRTDSVGKVNCQSVDVVLQVEDVDANPSDYGTAQVFNSSASSVSHSVNEIEPDDVYQCQVCYTEPIFEWSTNQICVGEPVEFYNTTQVGLICFQEWELEGPEVPGGIVFPGSADTISYVFNVPGDYTMTLRSICDSAEQFFVIPLFVHEVHLDDIELSDYNGVEVSCPGSEDGTATGFASGGSSPGNYQWEWVMNGELLYEDEEDLANLPAGTLEAVVFDYLGCSDTMSVVLQEPAPLAFNPEALIQYNGYAVSCPDASDGVIAMGVVNGGVGGYSSVVMDGSDLLPLSGLSAGAYMVQLTDANGCEALDSVLLVPPPPPYLSLEDFLDSCESGNGAIEATFNCGVPPCSLVWPEDVGNAETINGILERVDGLSGGMYSVSVVDGNGCTEALSIQVEQTLVPIPSLSVYPEEGCTPDLEVTIEESGNNDVAYRHFDFGDGEELWTSGDDSLSVRRQIHRYDKPGTYPVAVELTNADGCTETVSQNVVVHEGLSVFVPNSFTPANDGVNDGWRAEGVGVESFDLMIIDRWGEVLFETDDMERYWNGSPRGEGLSHMNDLFIYMIEVQGICEDFDRLTGTITLVR